MISKFLNKKSLYYQLLIVLFGGYFFVNVSVSLVQMYYEYNYNKNKIYDDLVTLKNEHHNSLADALWTYNEVLIRSLSAGVMSRDLVVGVTVYDSLNEKSFEQLQEGVDIKSTSINKYSFDLIYEKSTEKNKRIGYVVLYWSNEIVSSRVKDGVRLIVINSVFAAIVIFLLFVYFLRKKVSLPLTQFSNFTKNFNLQDDTDKRLELDFKEENELKVLERSFNSMIDELISNHQKLKTLNESLEQKVIVRTKELELAMIEAKKASESKSLFLANMSHEIRTPLNGVLGMIDIIHNTELTSDQRDMVETVRTSGNLLLSVINDILDMSKIESGKLEIDEVEFDISQCLNDIVSLMSFQASDKGIKLLIEGPVDISHLLIGDVTRIRQIVLNLVSNAIKFTNKGSVTVRFSIKEKDNKKSLMISVKDDGIGIAENSLKDLFNPFTQADSSVTRTYGGTGLGLSICKRLAEMMGGDISVESKEGVGSTFTLCLNLKSGIESSTKAKEIEKNDDSDFSKHYPHRILVVEDNKINQKIVMTHLKKLGYECESVWNGAEAVQAFEEIRDGYREPYTIVLMDMQMPIMDGLTATKTIASMMKDEAPPIIALTANVFVEDKEKCYEAGMKDFLAKPLKLEELKRALSHWGNK